MLPGPRSLLLVLGTKVWTNKPAVVRAMGQITFIMLDFLNIKIIHASVIFLQIEQRDSIIE